MKKIFKYILEITDEQVVRMPRNAEILTAQVQRDNLCIWAVVDENESVTSRRILVVGTGNSKPDFTGCRYVGTAAMFDGELMWHVFDGGPV